MAGEATYEILDGVRRSKAAYIVGRTSIAAQVNGVGDVMFVSLASLRSPKDAIDTSGVRGLSWGRVLRAVQNEVELPPIEIMPGARGIPIADVQVIEDELDALRRNFEFSDTGA